MRARAESVAAFTGAPADAEGSEDSEDPVRTKPDPEQAQQPPSVAGTPWEQLWDETHQVPARHRARAA